MEETKRLLVENSHLPMSIILVGVGRGDMSKMDILDDDNRTMSWNGRRSERDIVQFVEMSKYLPDQCLDPFTFHSVMDAANAKYHLARVRSRNGAPKERLVGPNLDVQSNDDPVLIQC